MSVNYNPRARLVTADEVQSVTILNMTTTFNSDRNGSYTYEGYHNVTGCGGPESGVLILLKDNIPWTRMSFLFEASGNAACWSFMSSEGQRAIGTGTPTGNMLEFSEAAGDRIYDGYLSYTGNGNVGGIDSPKTSRCDTDAANWMNFNTGGVFRRFRMTRRRNVGAGLAGIHHGRSCNGTGTGNVTRISNIFIWV
jgi:hypothetical protein